MLRSAILALSVMLSMAPVAWAQFGLPASYSALIQDAARAPGGPNTALAAAVVRLIAFDPGRLEAVVATAVSLAPAERNYIVQRASLAFPGFQNRIGAAAQPARAQILQRPVSPPLARAPIPPAASAPPPIAVVPPPPRPPAPRPAAPPLEISQSGFADGKDSGLYADLGAGLVVVQDSDLSDPALGALTGTLSSDLGFAVSGAVGYKFTSNLRAEGEIAYRSNDLDAVTVGGFGLTSSAAVDGSVSVLSGLASGYFDIPLGGRITPFVGAGIGVARVNVDISNTSTDESDIVFAYQGAGGFRFPVLDRATYKFFATANPTINTTEGEYFSHTFEIGYYYEF